MNRAFSTVNYGRSTLVGASFAIGWTPCIGPILGAIFGLAASSSTVLHGAALLAFWSAGLSLPFLAAGLAMGSILKWMAKIRHLMPVLEFAGGIIVIFVGILIFLDRFTIFNQYFGNSATTVVGGESRLDALGIDGPLGFAVAFGAGIIAVLSPCCLPLVPAYIAHLAGASGAAEDDSHRRGEAFRHALAFVFGFSLVFVVLGASIGAVGYVLREQMPTIQKAAGVVLIVMGMNLAGIIQIPFLQRTYQLPLPDSAKA